MEPLSESDRLSEVVCINFGDVVQGATRLLGGLLARNLVVGSACERLGLGRGPRGDGVVAEHLLGVGADLGANACADIFSNFFPVLVVKFNR